MKTMSLQKRWTIFLSYGFVVHKPLFLVQVFCVCVCGGHFKSNFICYNIVSVLCFDFLATRLVES